MNAKKIALLVILGTCILGLSAFGSKKSPVERPWKSVHHQTLVITLDAAGIPVSWEVSGIVHCTHLGLSENRGGGTFNLDGSPVGTGVTAAANGDQVFWAGGATTAFFTGGTGRFEGASGSVTAVSMEIVFRPGPPEGPLVADMVLINEGTITY